MIFIYQVFQVSFKLIVPGEYTLVFSQAYWNSSSLQKGMVSNLTKLANVINNFQNLKAL